MRWSFRWGFLATLLAAAPLHAEEWKHEVAPYLFGAGLNGTVGVGAVTGDVDVGFGDILDHLDFGFMGAYRGSKDRYSVILDAIYAALEASGTGPAGFVNADADLDMTLIEAHFGYALNDRFTVYGGFRYNDLDTKVKITGPLGNTLSAEKDESWVDPVIGAHYTWPFSESWSATLRGDVGGFGVGSDFAWQGIATLRWQTSPRLGVLFAYRYLDTDYENGSGSDFFEYDMAMHGPAAGVVFTF